MDKYKEINYKLDKIQTRQAEMFLFIMFSAILVLQHSALNTGRIFSSFFFGIVGLFTLIILFKTSSKNSKTIFNKYFKVVEKEVKK